MSALYSFMVSEPVEQRAPPRDRSDSFDACSSPLRAGLAVAGCLLLLCVALHHESALAASGDQSVGGAVLSWMKANKVMPRFRERSEELALYALIALPLQLLFPAVKRSPKIFTSEFWIDLLVYWYSAAILRIIGFYAVIYAVRDVVYGKDPSWMPALASLPFPVQVALYLWAYDFVVYWRHRVEHTFGLFWAFHATHHTAERVDFLTTSRLHPGERFFGGILSGALAALAFDAEAASLGFSIYLYWNYFVHTNVRIKFPGFLKYIVVSPFMHQWHHAKDAAAYGRNVGVVFAWNDWLFRSAYHPNHWPTDFGLGFGEQKEVGHNPIKHFLFPIPYWTRRFRDWRARRATTRNVGPAEGH